MKTWMKVVLAVLVLGVLTCGLIVGGAAWWFDSNKEQLKADGDKVKAEAADFARGTDADGCVAEALRRLAAKSGFMDEVRHRVFLGECLRQAPRRPNFCLDVPERSSLIAAAAWSVDFCADKAGVDPQACGRLTQEVLEACGGSSNETDAPPR
ncbi:MAG: hypothetical protein MUC96_12575 [Myxococcaceae bacterium]|jgi:hypothetical protein|nr:hypothetical protein [Myxococcaceae bacterium]